MRIVDLAAQFLGRIQPDKSRYVVDTLAEAQGVMFQCPKCAQGRKVEERSDGRRCVAGVHYVICWFRDRGVPDDMNPKPGRWTPSGTCLEDLSFVPGEPAMATSVKLTNGCMWHGHIVNGEATVLPE